jgi:chemotaxis protein methyltransferase CheR
VDADLSRPIGPPASQPISPESYRFLQDYVYRESGIVIDAGKTYLLEARLLPLVRQHRVGSINDLCDRLRANHDGALRLQVVDAMTTNETLFFREVPQYDALRTLILPALIKQHQATRTLTFWSAASSSGQEAYSLAMLLLEMGLRDWRLDIFASDLSGHILERARSARYLQIEVNRGLPIAYLVKYFAQHGVEWQLNDDVRRMVRFSRFDLRQSMVGLGPFDVVFCRNVLIYFDDPTKKAILRGLRGTIDPHGYLLLGGAEAILQLDAQFTRETIGQAVIYRPVTA